MGNVGIDQFELRRLIRLKSKEFNRSPRLIYKALQPLVKPLNRKTIKTVCNILAMNNCGFNTIDSRSLAFVEGIDEGTAYNKLHILGDKGVLVIVYSPKDKSKETRKLFQYKISKQFFDALKKKKVSN